MHKFVQISNYLGFAALAFSAAVLQTQQPSNRAGATEKLPSFEVASIKPSMPGDSRHDWDSNSDSVSIENYSLRDLIAYAYNLKLDSQVLGGPSWLDNRHFDVAAKVGDLELAKLKTMSASGVGKEWNQMMQSLLADRFGLLVSHDQRTIPVLALVVAKSGQKLMRPREDETSFNLSARGSHLTATSVSMAAFADYLTRQPETAGRVVIDRTGLPGKFDFKLDWTRDRGNGIPSDSQFAGLMTALSEQLGLKLKRGKAATNVVVVQSVKEPDLD
jgi:uncharacterized protein (TIGR03435 family)